MDGAGTYCAYCGAGGFAAAELPDNWTAGAAAGADLGSGEAAGAGLPASGAADCGAGAAAATATGAAGGKAMAPEVHSAIPWRQTRSVGRRWPSSTIFRISASVTWCGLPSRARYHSIGCSFSDMRVRSDLRFVDESRWGRIPGTSHRQLPPAALACFPCHITVPALPELFPCDAYAAPHEALGLASDRGNAMATTCPTGVRFRNPGRIVRS